jgi:hypothetical protein
MIRAANVRDARNIPVVDDFIPGGPSQIERVRMSTASCRRVAGA